MVKYYNMLRELGCFTLEDTYKFISNKETAKNMLKNYVKKGYIARIKRNYYVTWDIVNNNHVCNKYVIASNLDSSSYIAYHSELEYYAYHNQITNEIVYCSNKRLNDFEFDGINYHYVANRCNLQIDNNVDGSRVTTLERTIIDCIDNLYLSFGIEVIFKALNYIYYLDEDKLLEIFIIIIRKHYYIKEVVLSYLTLVMIYIYLIIFLILYIPK